MSVIFIILILLVLIVLVIKVLTRKRNNNSYSSYGVSSGIFDRMKKVGAECCNKILGKNHGI